MPRWDMTTLYPGPDSPAFVRDRDAAVQAVADVVKLFERTPVSWTGSVEAAMGIGCILSSKATGVA